MMMKIIIILSDFSARVRRSMFSRGDGAPRARQVDAHAHIDVARGPAVFLRVHCQEKRTTKTKRVRFCLRLYGRITKVQ